MDQNQQQQNRKHPAHPAPVERFNEPVVLYVTVCAEQRKPILANVEVQSALLSIWPEADHWQVIEYLLMPDHLHLFCTPGKHEHLSVKRWAKYWKYLFSCENPALKSIWQRDCWDTQMRTYELLEEKRHYVRQNPVRAGFVERAEDWPWRGTPYDFRW